MPIFGFVLTLASCMDGRRRSLEQLASEPGITLGAPNGLRLPVVLETDPDTRHEDRVARWLELPGIVHVDYAFADFADLVSDARERGERA